MNKAKETNVIKTKRAYILSLSNGVTRKEAAEAAGVSCYTIWNWAKKDEGFAKEIENALESRITIVEDALLKTATGSASKGQVAAQIFYLKNRGKEKWKDKQEVEHKIPDTINVKHFIQAGEEPVIEDEEELLMKEKEVLEEPRDEDTKGIKTVL